MYYIDQRVELREFKRLLRHQLRTRDRLEKAYEGLDESSQDSMEEYIDNYIEDVRHSLYKNINCIFIAHDENGKETWQGNNNSI